MKRAIGLLAAGAAIGAGAYRVALELRKPAAEQFPWLRRQVNETVNPWLLEHHIPGSATAEIGTLEHVGRRSGIAHFTPVHPTIRDDVVLVPAPLGVGSHWAQNALHAGKARLQFKEMLYELDRPELIAVTDTGFFPAAIAGPFDRMGWRYLRFHVAATAPGAFAAFLPEHEATMPEPPLTEPYEIPVEPRMVEREGSPA